MSSRSGRMLVATLAPALGLVLGACGAAAPAKAGAGAPETALAERRTLDVKAEAAGTVQPIVVVEVKSKASGEVLALHAETGDEVKRGTLLAEIDPRDVRNGLAQAEADLEVARVKLQTSVEQKKRSQELRKSNVITEQEFEAAALDEANGRAQLVKAQTNLQLAQQRMGDVTIGAPIDGTIIEKTVERGQIIASASQTVSGGTTLFKMADLATMQVRALVDETDIGRVQPGQVTRVSVEAFPGRAFIGEVQKIEPQAVVDQNVTMFPVLIRLDNAERLLKPGMNAEVEIQVARRENALVVPNDAVLNPRDAVGVGKALGLGEEDVRTALERSREQAFAGGRSNPAAAGAARPAATAPGGAGAGARGAAGAAPAGGQAAAAGLSQADCTALREKIRSGGGFASLSDGDRSKLRECRTRFGGGGAFGGGFAGGPGGGPGGRSGRASGMRPGVLFVQTANGPEPRMVLLGVNDWDYTEVVRGLEPGDRVIMAAVARLQQQQQDMQNQIRQRAGGGMFGGGGAPAGGAARPARGGRGG